MDDIKNKFREISDRLNKVNDEKNRISKGVLDLLKGADMVSVIPEVLADIFESLDYEDEDYQKGISNQIMQWGVDHYVTRKVRKLVLNIEALYLYCIDKGYNEDNKWEYGGGDRVVCFIKHSTYRILLFSNQNMEFVLVIKDRGIHIRRVYESIFEQDDYGFYSVENSDNVEHLREKLKQDNGLEIAVGNLINDKWSDCVPGNIYPKKIDLSTMKKFDFGENCKSFRYNDSRDAGYLLSLDTLGRCDVADYRRISYVWSDIVSATGEVPSKYLKSIKRESQLSDILNDL